MNLNEFLTGIGFFAKYPYTDFHEMNLDWAITQIAQLRVEFDDFAHVNSLKYAGEWDITKAYSAFSVVDDQGFGYMALKPVPPGTQINDTEYWLMVVDYSQITQDYENRISALETTVGDASSGLVKDVDDLQSDMTNVQSDITALQGTVGDASSGLVKDVDDLQSDMTNAQNDITNLQGTVGDASSGLVKDVDDLQTDIAALRSEVFRPRRYIFISDSYGYHPSISTSWIPQTASIMGLGLSDYYDWYEGSMGFIHLGGGGHTVETLARSKESTVLNKNSITDVVFIGGVNDAYYINDYTMEQLGAAIESFCDYIVNTYPNAKVHLGMAGNWIGKNQTQYTALYNLPATYKNSITHYNGSYIDNIEYILHNYTLLGDTQHPSADGALELAKCISAHLIGNSFDARYTMGGTFQSTGTATINAGNAYFAMVENENTTVEITGYVFSLSSAVTSPLNMNLMRYDPHKFGCPDPAYINFYGVMTENYIDPINCKYSCSIDDPNSATGGLIKLTANWSTHSILDGSLPQILVTIPTMLF